MLHLIVSFNGKIKVKSQKDAMTWQLDLHKKDIDRNIPTSQCIEESDH